MDSVHPKNHKQFIYLLFLVSLYCAVASSRVDLEAHQYSISYPVQNGPRRSKTVRDGPKRSETVKTVRTVQNGPRRSKTVRDGPKRFKMKNR